MATYVQRSIRVVYCELEMKFFHNHEFVGQNEIGGFVTIAFEIADKLDDGDVELFHFAS